MQQRRPVMLAILDGWGWREEAADNAVRQARTPTFRNFCDFIAELSLKDVCVSGSRARA